jgi:hypothetical protein
MIYNLAKIIGQRLRALACNVETRSLHVIVSSDHPSADEQVAEAIARVVSRYAVDLRPEIEVNVPHAGSKVTYVAKAVNRRPATALPLPLWRR